MKILLVFPPLTIGAKELTTVMPPNGLLSIAGALESDGHQVTILDNIAKAAKTPKILGTGHKYYGVSDQEYIELVKKVRPDIVGISNLLAATNYNCLHIAKLTKLVNKDTIVIMGGTNCSAQYDWFIEHDVIDYVVIGEGEPTMKNLVKRVPPEKIPGIAFKKDGKIIKTEPRPFLNNLDELPIPAYHLLDMESYFVGMAPIYKKKRMVSISTSRGCVRNCIFCSGRKYLGPLRKRSPQKVIEEIKLLVNNYNVEEIQFLDPNIQATGEHFKELLLLMEKEKLNIAWTPIGGTDIEFFDPLLIKKMRKTGCYYLPISIEHGDPNMQKRIGKIISLEKVKQITAKCKKYGIITNSCFVLGLPGETEESAFKILDIAIKSGIESMGIFFATPLPGSRLYDKCPVTDPDIIRFEKTTSVCDLKVEKLHEIRTQIFKQFVRKKMIGELNPLNIYYRLINISNYGFVLFRMFKRYKVLTQKTDNCQT